MSTWLSPRDPLSQDEQAKVKAREVVAEEPEVSVAAEPAEPALDPKPAKQFSGGGPQFRLPTFPAEALRKSKPVQEHGPSPAPTAAVSHGNPRKAAMFDLARAAAEKTTIRRKTTPRSPAAAIEPRANVKTGTKPRRPVENVALLKPTGSAARGSGKAPAPAPVKRDIGAVT